MEACEWSLLGCSSIPVALIIFLVILTLKNADKKTVKASSPLLLYIVLLGQLLLFCESILYTCDVTSFSCIAAVWCRHVGCFLVYGTILLKLWRVSVIIRSVRARLFQIKDSQLCKKLLVLLLAGLIYLTTWTSARANQMMPRHVHCAFLWWDVVIHFVELLLLLLCAVFCYQTKQAPSVYNESTCIGLAVWNEAIWIICYIIIRIFLEFHPSKMLFQATHLLRTYLTCLPFLALLFLPKFYRILRKDNEMHGVLTDVTITRRVHKLSVVVNKNGDLRTIHCVPCGPLQWDGITEVKPHIPHVFDSEEGYQENEYTRAEVDNLIAMLHHLKQENDAWKKKTSQLLYIVQYHGLPVDNPLLQDLNYMLTSPQKNSRLKASRQLVLLKSRDQYDCPRERMICLEQCDHPANEITEKDANSYPPIKSPQKTEFCCKQFDCSSDKLKGQSVHDAKCQTSRDSSAAQADTLNLDREDFQIPLKAQSALPSSSKKSSSKSHENSANRPITAFDMRTSLTDSGIMVSSCNPSPFRRPPAKAFDQNSAQAPCDCEDQPELRGAAERDGQGLNSASTKSISHESGCELTLTLDHNVPSRIINYELHI